jgi:hypothetical protein
VHTIFRGSGTSAMKAIIAPQTAATANLFRLLIWSCTSLLPSFLAQRHAGSTSAAKSVSTAITCHNTSSPCAASTKCSAQSTEPSSSQR